MPLDRISTNLSAVPFLNMQPEPLRRHPRRLSPVLFLTVALSLAAASAFAQTATPPPAAPPDLPDAPAPAAAAAAQPEPVPTGPTIVFDTTMGRLTCKTFDKQAPNAVANFIGLAEGTKDWSTDQGATKQHGKRFYDGLSFHQIGRASCRERV